MVNVGYWGKGYGKDALRVLAQYLFQAMNLHRIQLDTWDENNRALRAFEGLGFQVEGRLRQAVFVRGKYHDSIVMGLLRDEWEEPNVSARSDKPHHTSSPALRPLRIAIGVNRG